MEVGRTQVQETQLRMAEASHGFIVIHNKKPQRRTVPGLFI